MAMTTPDADEPPAARRGRPPSAGKENVLASALELLRERGASRLTTREVARRAGVSEGSVFYHFRDRAGLMSAVIEDGVQALRPMHDGLTGDDVTAALRQFASAVEGFLDKAVTVMIAAQSDSELRDALGAYLVSNDMGPHRGIQVLATYLRDQQARGHVRDDIDATAAAYLAYAACFQRVAQRQMLTTNYERQVPGSDEVMATVGLLLAAGSGEPLTG